MSEILSSIADKLSGYFAAATSTRLGTFGVAAAGFAAFSIAYHNAISYIQHKRYNFSRIKVRLQGQEGGYDVNLHYKLTGVVSPNAPLVVFVSGTGWSLDCWSYLQGEVSKHAATLSYDRMGIGHSDYNSNVQTRPLVAYAQELRALLTAINHKGPVVIVGHSFGGAIVRLFTAQYSSEVDIRSVILLDSICEDMVAAHPELLPELPHSTASWIGWIVGRLPLIRTLVATGAMWKMVTSHPGSEILVNNPVQRRGMNLMSQIMSWPHGFQTMMAEISTMTEGFGVLSAEARKDLREGQLRHVISIVAEQSVGAIVPPQPHLFPSFVSYQRALSAILNGGTTTSDTFKTIADANHASILASEQVAKFITAAL